MSHQLLCHSRKKMLGEINFHLSYMHFFSRLLTHSTGKRHFLANIHGGEESLPSAASWHGGEQKQVGVVVGSSSLGTLLAAGAVAIVAQAGDRQ
jgi:hypothetical protein